MPTIGQARDIVRDVGQLTRRYRRDIPDVRLVIASDVRGCQWLADLCCNVLYLAAAVPVDKALQAVRAGLDVLLLHQRREEGLAGLDLPHPLDPGALPFFEPTPRQDVGGGGYARIDLRGAVDEGSGHRDLCGAPLSDLRPGATGGRRLAANGDPLCEGLTKRRTRCLSRALPGGPFCEWHDPSREPPTSRTGREPHPARGTAAEQAGGHRERER